MQPNNGELNNSVQEENYVDPRTINAEVIGELRKDKIGKPLLVVEVFGLLLLVLVTMPVVITMLDDEDSFLYKLVNKGSINTPATPNPGNVFLDAKEMQSLSSSTNMKYENLVLKNFVLNSSSLQVTLYSFNDIINLDEGDYYLEIYSNSSNLLAALKLTGTYDYQEKQVTMTHPDLHFNLDYGYFGKVVEMTKADYPKFDVNSDESGIGSLVCKKDGQTLEYTFKNNYLISLKDSYHYQYNSSTPQVYMNALESYQQRKNALGNLATIQEVADGFQYEATIDLEAEGFSYPTSFKDYNYFALDTEAKVIHYSMRGKGYDCQ